MCVVTVNLDDAFRRGIILRPGKIHSKAKHDVGTFNRICASTIAQNAGHSYVVGVLGLDEFLGTAGVNHGCLELFGQSDNLIMGRTGAESCINCHRLSVRKDIGQSTKLIVGRQQSGLGAVDGPCQIIIDLSL